MLNISIVLTTTLLLLAGCALTPIQLEDRTSDPLATKQIRASSLLVVDLSKPSNASDDPLFSTGFSRLPDRYFFGSVGETLKKSLQRAVTASGEGKELDIWILDVGFHIEIVGSDHVPIINWFPNSTRRFMCAALITAKSGRRSETVRVEQIIPIATEGKGEGDDPLRATIRTCYAGLVPKVVAKIGDLAN